VQAEKNRQTDRQTEGRTDRLPRQAGVTFITRKTDKQSPR